MRTEQVGQSTFVCNRICFFFLLLFNENSVRNSVPLEFIYLFFLGLNCYVLKIWHQSNDILLLFPTGPILIPTIFLPKDTPPSFMIIFIRLLQSCKTCMQISSLRDSPLLSSSVWLLGPFFFQISDLILIFCPSTTNDLTHSLHLVSVFSLWLSLY